MLNSAILMGRLTADPELKHTQSGIAMTRFTLAIDRRYAKPGEEKKTDFIDILAWRNTAEFISKYFHKGQLVAVEGSIQTGSYQDKEGIKRRTFEVVANNVHFAEPFHGKGNNDNSDYQPSNNTDEDNNQKGQSYTNGNTGDFEEVPVDDDLPF